MLVTIKPKSATPARVKPASLTARQSPPDLLQPPQGPGLAGFLFPRLCRRIRSLEALYEDLIEDLEIACRRADQATLSATNAARSINAVATGLKSRIDAVERALISDAASPASDRPAAARPAAG